MSKKGFNLIVGLLLHILSAIRLLCIPASLVEQVSFPVSMPGMTNSVLIGDKTASHTYTLNRLNSKGLRIYLHSPM